MAAWKARVDSISATNDEITIAVSYFDATDTTFGTLLYARTVSLPCNSSLGDAQALIVQTGQTVRAAQNTSAALQPRVGTTINVP